MRGCIYLFFCDFTGWFFSRISCLFYMYFLRCSVNGKLINSSGAIFQEKALFQHTSIHMCLYIRIRPPLLVGHSKPFRRCCNIIWNYVGISCFLWTPVCECFFFIFLRPCCSGNAMKIICFLILFQVAYVSLHVCGWVCMCVWFVVYS